MPILKNDPLKILNSSITGTMARGALPSAGSYDHAVDHDSILRALQHSATSNNNPTPTSIARKRSKQKAARAARKINRKAS